MTTTQPSLDYEALVSPIQGTPFATLRAGQEAALRRYAATDFRARDLAIELPTGAGKSLIALLILEHWRAQGHRVAVLTGNKTLARQLEAEAEVLGVPVVRFEGTGADLSAADLRSYRRAEAIGVMNYWVYINQNPRVEPATYLVLDDAQLCEGALTSLYTVQITRRAQRDLFENLMRMIADRTPSPMALDAVREISTGPSPGRPADLLPFIQFSELAQDFEITVDEYLSQNSLAHQDLRFRWGRVRRKLEQCLCLLSADEIELRPGSFPALSFTHLEQPTQRLYLSATLHDPADLQRRLGTSKITKMNLPPEVVVEDDGRRLFIFNQGVTTGSSNEVPKDVLAPLRELLLTSRKSIWLCSTGVEADFWQAWLQDFESEVEDDSIGDGVPVWRLQPLGDELEEFRDAACGHLIIAGRFEGMDFPDNACRLTVLPSVPAATNLLERFTADQLRDADFQLDRMRERVKQAIGRCTRGRDDYAVYFLIDPKFALMMEDAAFGRLVTEQTRKQIEVGLMLTQSGLENVVPVARQFLAGNFTEYERRIADARPPILRDPPPAPALTSQAEVLGWEDMYERHDYLHAAERFEEVVDNLGDSERELRGFWCYLAAQAEFLANKRDQAPAARDRCLNWLDRAIREGAASSWFNRLRRTVNSFRGQDAIAVAADPSHEIILERWDARVESQPYQGGRFQRWQLRIQRLLGGSHNECAEGLEVIGELLGYHATRPEGSGTPDCLWQRDGIVTLEAKIEQDRTLVVLGDVNQANGQRTAAPARYGARSEAVHALIVTNLADIDPVARAALGPVRVLSLQSLELLRTRLESIMAEYWRAWSRENARQRLNARQAASRRLPPAGWLERAIDASPGPFLTSDQLLREWPAA